MPFNAGDIFLARFPLESTTPHLCVALSDQDGFPPSVFIVPIMTPKNGTDRTLMLPTSVCPDFLVYESCVVYDEFHLVEAEKLEALVIRRYLPGLQTELLFEVQENVFRSDRPNRGERQAFKEYRATK